MPVEQELRQSFRLKQKSTPRKLEDEASTPTKQPSPVKKKGRIKGIRTPITGEPTMNLATILDIPLDIMHEISANLWPVDLLLLARTCKAIREILMSQKSKFIWKAARKCCFSMIDPPEGLSEPLYAHLGFGSTCDICDSKSNVVVVKWLDQLLVCYSCSNNLSAYVTKHVWKSLRVSTVLPASIIGLLSCSVSGTGNARYSKPRSVKWKEEYRKLRNDSEKDAWTSKTRNWVSTMKRHDAQFNSWLRTKQWNLDTLRAKLESQLIPPSLNNFDIDSPLCSVLNHLETTREEFHKMDYKWYYQLTKMINEVDARDLNQAWSTLKSPAMSLLKKARAERSLQDSLKTFETVFMSHNLSLVPFPDHVEIAFAPQFRTIFEAPKLSTDETFLKSVPKEDLRDAIKTWEEATSLKVLQLMRDSLKNPRLETKDLCLAASIFFCKQCAKFLYYPEVSVHSCAFEGDKLKRFRALWKLAKLGKNPTSWNDNRQILFRKQDHEAAVNLLRVIDRTNYSVVTKDEMDEKGILIQCLDCRQTRRQFIEQKRHTFSWFSAMLHARDIHGFDLPSQVSWKIPGPDGQALLRAEAEHDTQPSTLSRYILTERE